MGALRQQLKNRPLIAKVYRASVAPALWHTKRKFGALDRELVEKYLAAHPRPKLQIGCGINYLPGWLNSDCYPLSTEALHLDATKPFPFDDATFDYVYSEHMIEHVPLANANAMLAECFRVMKPGARIRIATPDFEFLLRLYNDPAEPMNKAYTEWLIENATPNAPKGRPIYLINNFVRDWNHQFIFDRASLTDSLTTAGFAEVTWHELQASSDEQLANLANESRTPPGFVAHETMTAEAVKPG